MGDDRIRKIVREELHRLFGTFAKQLANTDIDLVAVPTSDGRVTFEPRGEESPLEIDRIVDAVEREAYEPVLQSYSLRKEAGMSDALAEVMAKLERGIDPTPLGYDLPPRASHFQNEAFKTSFLNKLRAGKGINESYETTCAEFGLNAHKKMNPLSRVLPELPSQAGGGFSLSAGEVTEKFGLDRQLEAGSEDEEKPVKKGGIFED